MKAYWVANYTEIKDDERLKKYAVKAKEAVEKYSGKIIGIKGQYLIFEDDTVFNIRSNEGVVVNISLD